MKCWPFLICLLGMVAGVQSATEYRDFTSTEGKVIRGCIKAFDARKKMVTIERDNKRTAKVPIAVFSEADQAYIHRWQSLAGIRSTSKFKISCERRKVKSWSEKQYGSVRSRSGSEGTQETGKTNYEETGYEFEFVNRNECSIKDLTLEYCIYYEQEVRQHQDAQQGVLFRSLPIDEIDRNGKKIISTDSVCVFEYDKGAQFINSYSLKGKLIGLSMRLYLVADGEKTLVREATFPDSLSSSYAWVTESKPVGEN